MKYLFAYAIATTIALIVGLILLQFDLFHRMQLFVGWVWGYAYAQAKNYVKLKFPQDK